MTQREEYESEIRTCKQLLKQTDYIALKLAEGATTKEGEYNETFTKRAEWRARINELEGLIAELPEEQAE